MMGVRLKIVHSCAELFCTDKDQLLRGLSPRSTKMLRIPGQGLTFTDLLRLIAASCQGEGLTISWNVQSPAHALTHIVLGTNAVR